MTLLQKPLSLFQNPVGANLRFDGQALGKTGQKPGFSTKFKVACQAKLGFPKAEVLEQPPYKEFNTGKAFIKARQAPGRRKKGFVTTKSVLLRPQADTFER
jgi:hypothetical protein